MNMTIEQFYKKQGPFTRMRRDKHKLLDCKEHMLKYKNMNDFFANSTKYPYVLWAVLRKNVLTEKESITFACWCIRQEWVWDLLEDERSKNVVVMAEKYVEGAITKKELTPVITTAKIRVDEVYDIFKSSLLIAPYKLYAITATACIIKQLHYMADATALATNSSSEADAFHKVQVEYLREHFTPNFEA